MTARPARPAPAPRRELAAFLALLVAGRLALLAALALFVGGREPTDDVAMHMFLVRHPWDLLLGGASGFSQHPPLLPLVEAAVAWPLQLALPDFYAIRLTYVVYDAAAAALLWLTLDALGAGRDVRRRVALAWILVPMTWMSSVVMAQDEVIGTAWLGLVFLLLARRRPGWALATAGLGIAAGKIFLAVPLAALVFGLRRWSLVRRGVVGALPAVAVYGWATAFALARGLPPPLAGFVLAVLGINVWVLAGSVWPLAPGTVRSLSAGTSLLGGLAPVPVFLLRRRPAGGVRDLAALSGVMLLGVLLLAYNSSPEYFLLATWPLLVAFHDRAQPAILGTALSSTWAVNLFYGVAYAERSGVAGGKAAFVHLYRRLVPLPPDRLYPLSVAVAVAALLAVAAWALPRLGRLPDPEPGERGPR